LDTLNILSAVGLEKGVIYETIVSTRAPDGTPNAAPMGVRSFDGRTLMLLPFKSTRTYRNLLATRTAVANITDDPQLFYDTALKEGTPCPREMFEEAKHVEAPRLTHAESIIELTVSSIRDEGPDRARVDCDPVYSEVLQLRPKPYCRGKLAAMEAIIHATRVKVFLKEGRREEADRLIQSILSYKALAERIGPKSSYLKVIEDVVAKVREWERGG
jgi:hypothetical protein